ncbi:16S rRNA (cytidine(1402)-2'-O)-methyltransferase [Paracoccus sp. MC1862]|uniref:16S rRNA (cytidine(1402)-2'-O)-methyltransferase n=1 Tax=Paracoccus sp. MC1862 TaxID=2760307 RepID=UPI0016016C5A|nr:16S rRNA (cytidine(1402)-2'-O)-methyltransferase [Paracoccus sp. MC1862]MBB1497193.1 16S rRNA (cytidine(1402)-2'-O)-methyltransferase [Paracoccus sp. MC1862]QQO44831.1 16S rRNA (cytidine(1402)-2'-O)-methyltransferase [Paracoccus sp. MC1862]
MREDERSGRHEAVPPGAEPARVLAASVLASRLDPGLYLVATPIGAARDITLRALDVLNAADLLAAEDTRTLRHLMSIHGVPLRGRRILAYHDHNADRARPSILTAINEGLSVAYCSDAGTPLVADPGFRLSRDVAEAGGRVHAVPGASALLAALTVAGLPTDRFLFAGFAPSQKGARRRWLERQAGLDATVVIFESPRRVKDMLKDLCEIDGDRDIAVCRELTKKFEEVLRGPARTVMEAIPEEGLRGEVVVVMAPAGEVVAGDEAVRAALACRLGRMTMRDAAAEVAVAVGRPRKDVYRMALAMQEERDDDGADALD